MVLDEHSHKNTAVQIGTGPYERGKTMSNSILDKSIKVQEDLVARNNDDGTIVVMRMDESNLFFKIDGVAAEVWKGLNANKNLKQIYADIKAGYDVSDDQLLNDMEAFIGDLQSRDLVQIS